jgi:hypothetical protein
MPDFKSVGSVFYSKTVFGADTFRIGVTVNFVDSEHDIGDNFKGTNPLATLDAPGYSGSGLKIDKEGPSGKRGKNTSPCANEARTHS